MSQRFVQCKCGTGAWHETERRGAAPVGKVCQSCGQPVGEEKDASECNAVHTNYGEGNGAAPIEMYSLAVNTDAEVDAFRDRNPGVTISKNRRDPLYGVPIARSRSQKKTVLRTERFEEMNGYG